MKWFNKPFVAILLLIALTAPVCTYAFSQSNMAYRDSGSSTSIGSSDISTSLDDSSYSSGDGSSIDEIPADSFSDDSSSGVGVKDIAPPVLYSVSISATEVSAPGKLTVTVHASDDVSGIGSITVGFTNFKNDRYAGTDFNINYDDVILNKTFTGKTEISKYEQSGLFKLDSVSLRDAAGNRINYRLKDDMYGDDKLLPYDLSFRVTNAAFPETDNPDSSSSSSSETSARSSESSTSSRQQYWDSVSDRVKNQSNMMIHAKAGDNIPANIFEEIYGKDITITITQEGKDDFKINGKTMLPIAQNQVYYTIEFLRELYGDGANISQSINAEQAAHDLAILYMSRQNIPKDQYVKYYLENYDKLYNQFYSELN